MFCSHAGFLAALVAADIPQVQAPEHPFDSGQPETQRGPENHLPALSVPDFQYQRNFRGLRGSRHGLASIDPHRRGCDCRRFEDP
jgi:hypothetical protein